MRHLHLDFETYSSVDIKSCGAYAYTQSPDFEIILASYYFEGESFDVEVADLRDNYLPDELMAAFVEAASGGDITIHAHNANFERLCLRAIGFNIHPSKFECSAVKAASAGLPHALAQVAKVLKLEEQKDKAGSALIRFFCMPCKPTKANGFSTRNTAEAFPAKWAAFKEYCRKDTEVELAICEALKSIKTIESEKRLYELDQIINDRGVRADLQLAHNAILLADQFAKGVTLRSEALTGLNNVNSVAQLKSWIEEQVDKDLDNLDKQQVNDLLTLDCADDVREVLENRQLLGKTSIKKYQAIVNAINADQRVRGLFQFYGAGRTGRWAGRLVQLQNLPQNRLEGKDLDYARQALMHKDTDLLEMLFAERLPDILSQLIRTALIPREGCTLVVSDFSAIEARVIAWIAGEQWRLDVFATHGKIYEASAARMFHVPIESIGKGSDYRKKGKVAELALGYQGGVNALVKMGGDKMGLSELEMKNIIKVWRKASPKIVQLWADLEEAAINTLESGQPSRTHGLTFLYLPLLSTLAIELPSGRRLHYKNARLVKGKFDKTSLVYEGLDATKMWSRIDSYGGKLAENIVQAIARDLLADTMLRAHDKGIEIVMHVHDEIVAECETSKAQACLDTLNEIMAAPPIWAATLPLRGDGFITEYYKKD